MKMKIGDRIVDSSGDMGTIVGFRQHPISRETQEAEIKFDNRQAGSLYTHRATKTLHLLNGKESLPEVLSDLYTTASKQYENACQSDNSHGQYVFGAQLAMIKLIAARVLNTGCHQ